MLLSQLSCQIETQSPPLATLICALLLISCASIGHAETASGQVANAPAVISGVDTGRVVKDVDPDGDNLLEVSGTLAVDDADSGEAYFQAAFEQGAYGHLYIKPTGSWFYAADNGLAAIQNLAGAEALIDTVTVRSADGTPHDIEITIVGVEAVGDITLNWVAPAEREDGSSLSMAEIAGYRVYYGLSQGDYTHEVVIDGGSTMSVTLNNLASGTYHIVVTAVDTAGRESAFSQETVWTKSALNDFGNCSSDPNGSLVPDAGGNSQRDTDGDGFGNLCDPDFNNDLIVNASDLAYMKTLFFSADANTDLNGDGVVNAADLARLKTLFFQPPGTPCCSVP